jgi:hypothetical protein
MGSVVPFKRRVPGALPDAELGLLSTLTGCWQVRRTGGWAERGHPRGVVVGLHGECLGVWSHCNGRYHYLSTDAGTPLIMVRDLEEAHAATLNILLTPPGIWPGPIT